MVIENLHKSGHIDFTDLKAFCLVGSDRFGMAKTLYKLCNEVTFGDFLVSLELPFPIKKLKTLKELTKIVGPIVVRLPFSWLYPTGEKAEKRSSRLEKYFLSHTVIAGDYHYIAKYHPDNLNGKIIITNTTTKENIAMLKSKKVKMIVTTTPMIGGRTFGTNLTEALLSVLIDKKSPSNKDFIDKINSLGFDKGTIYQ